MTACARDQGEHPESPDVSVAAATGLANGDAQACVASTEVCADGIDNDCDGYIDEPPRDVWGGGKGFLSTREVVRQFGYCE